MPKYLIERQIPQAGKLNSQELQSISRQSVRTLDEMGTQIQWVHSYVAGDKIYCVYLAPDEQMVREHARRAGFPADSVTAVSAIIDPSTAEGSV